MLRILNKLMQNESRQMEDEYIFLLRQTNHLLIKARESLRKQLMEGPLGTAKKGADQAAKQKEESDFGIGLAPAMKGVLLGDQVNTMMKVEGAMRDVNKILADRTLAQTEKDTIEALIKEGLTPEQIASDPKAIGLSGRSIDQLEKDIKKGGEDLKEAIKKGALDFEQIIAETGNKQKENAQRIADLQIKTIEKALGITKTREEGLVGLGDLTKDAQAIADLIGQRLTFNEKGEKQVDTSRDDEIRKRLAEAEDANKFGINIAELISEILKAEGSKIDMQGVMESIVGASVQGLIPDDRASEIAIGADNPRTAQEAAFKVVFEKMKAEMDSIDNLVTQQDALAEVLDRTKKVYEQMVGAGEGGEGGNIGKNIQDFGEKLRTAGESLENFKNFNVEFNAQTKSTSDLIASVTQLNDEAVVVVKQLASRVRQLEEHAGRLRGDPDPVGKVGEVIIK